MTGANASLVRQLRKRAAARVPAPADQAGHCDLCGEEVPPDHRHLLHLEERRIACACEACRALLGPTARGGRPEPARSG